MENQQHQIPKYRLDEVIAQNRRMEEELQSTRALLHKLVPAQQAPQAVDPEEKEFMERDPIAYKRQKDLEYKLKQVSASNFAIQEQSDRDKFIQYAGTDEANRLGNLIEKRLDDLRKKDIFTMNRTDLYNYIVGQEAISSKRKPKAAAATPEVPVKTNDDAPSSDPKTQGIIQSAAPASTSEPSLEELEKRLANQEF